MIGLATLGAVFLVVTGTEALYADLGHFGRGPIRFAWLTVALPALVAQLSRPRCLVLADPKVDREPFLSAVSRMGSAADGRCWRRPRP